MAGIFDSLFGATPPTTLSSATTTTNNLPDWYQDYMKGLLNYTSSSLPVAPDVYQGPTVAGLDPMQTQAFGQVGANVGNYQPALDSAKGLTQSGSTMFNQGDFNQFMNPYTQNVTDTIASLGARNLSENLLPAVNDTFTAAGQFGGTRNADFTNRAVRDTNQAVLNQQASTLMDSQNQAMGNYQTALGRQIQGGAQMGALAGQQQTYGMKDAAALDAAGQEQQTQAQKNLDAAQSVFTQTRDWPLRNIEVMNQALRGVNPPTQSSTNSSFPGQQVGSPLSQIAGAGTAAYGASKLFKAGGLVGALDKKNPMAARDQFKNKGLRPKTGGAMFPAGALSPANTTPRKAGSGGFKSAFQPAL